MDDLAVRKSPSVAPLVGAWIEMLMMILIVWILNVAPLVGAWIEIFNKCKFSTTLIVAPLVGAWIEIKSSTD